MNTVLSAALKSTPLHVIFAFIVMGGWAIYVNGSYPTPKPLIAGIVQGSISAGLTLFLKRTVDWMRPKFPYGISYVAPPLIASLTSACLLGALHYVANTPEIVRTIAVPLLVSVSYIFTYNFMRQREAKDEPDE